MLSLQPFPKGRTCCIGTLLPRPLGPPAHALGAGEQLPWGNGRIIKCESPPPLLHDLPWLPVATQEHSKPSPTRPWVISPASAPLAPAAAPRPLPFPKTSRVASARAFAYPSCLNCPACPCHSSGDSVASSRKPSHTPTQGPHRLRRAVPAPRARGSVSTRISPQDQGRLGVRAGPTRTSARPAQGGLSPRLAPPLPPLSPSLIPSDSASLSPAFLSTALSVSSSPFPSFPDS